MAKIIAVTACPTGIAHTFMAAEALKKAAAHHGYEIKVETQGSVGTKNTLTAEEIAAADVVIIGADTHVDKARFAGKAVYETSVGRALKETESVLREAFARRPPNGTAPAREAATAIMDGLTLFLQGLSGSNAVLVGLLLGGMMAVDVGGPINKAAYTFGVGLLASNTFMPMAAVMAGGMVPPLGIALATVLAKNRFSADEQIAGKAAAVLGIAFITEGAIPFAAKDPLRVIPACVAGAAVTGAISMYFECGLRAPHGGVFVLAIPNAVSHLGWYAVAIAAGTLVTTAVLLIVKRPLKEPQAVSLAASRGESEVGRGH
jgi:fructose-specific phosphotransferase system IIB component